MSDVRYLDKTSSSWFILNNRIDQWMEGISCDSMREKTECREKKSKRGTSQLFFSSRITQDSQAYSIFCRKQAGAGIWETLCMKNILPRRVVPIYRENAFSSAQFLGARAPRALLVGLLPNTLAQEKLPPFTPGSTFFNRGREKIVDIRDPQCVHVRMKRSSSLITSQHCCRMRYSFGVRWSDGPGGNKSLWTSRSEDTIRRSEWLRK